MSNLHLQQMLKTNVPLGRSSALDLLRFVSATPSSTDVFSKLLFEHDVCGYDAVIVVDQPGVRVLSCESMLSRLTFTSQAARL